ncbi:hypothetical protein [Halochromatium sp.]
MADMTFAARNLRLFPPVTKAAMLNQPLIDAAAMIGVLIEFST